MTYYITITEILADSFQQTHHIVTNNLLIVLNFSIVHMCARTLMQILLIIYLLFITYYILYHYTNAMYYIIIWEKTPYKN